MCGECDILPLVMVTKIKMQPDTMEAARQERKEAKRAFVNDYMRHTAKIIVRVKFPRHPGNPLSHIPSIIVTVVVQKVKLVTPKQLSRQNQQEITKVVYKSFEASVCGSSQ